MRFTPHNSFCQSCWCTILARGAGATCQRIHSVDDAAGQISYLEMLRCAHNQPRNHNPPVDARSQFIAGTWRKSRSTTHSFSPLFADVVGVQLSANDIKELQQEQECIYIYQIYSNIVKLCQNQSGKACFVRDPGVFCCAGC